MLFCSFKIITIICCLTFSAGFFSWFVAVLSNICAIRSPIDLINENTKASQIWLLI